MNNGTQYVVGVDTGGSFTDVLVIDKDGNTAIGKAETTPGELGTGVLNAVTNAAEKLGLSLEGLLGQSSALVQGTTIGTNILINRNGVKT
ncbi:hydantoinase/oxoprolinase N-terminal domain-containing protein, partial [Neptuniibacter sp.]|uniref:hydantoinase/oxoprolinase N-terminal domain-containing protein n=1 Tax=Neptuniibacter sp. TaxID=1962643 RepID=UPI002616557C